MFIREGRFDRRGSPHPSSESLTSLQGLDSALVPYEEAVRGEHDNVSHALSSPEDQSVRKIQFGQHITFFIQVEECFLNRNSFFLA